MTKRFIFGCGVLAGIIVGEIHVINKIMSIPEAREACIRHASKKFAHFLYGSDSVGECYEETY